LVVLQRRLDKLQEQKVRAPTKIGPKMSAQGFQGEHHPPQAAGRNLEGIAARAR